MEYDFVKDGFDSWKSCALYWRERIKERDSDASLQCADKQREIDALQMAQSIVGDLIIAMQSYLNSISGRDITYSNGYNIHMHR